MLIFVFFMLNLEVFVSTGSKHGRGESVNMGLHQPKKPFCFLLGKTGGNRTGAGACGPPSPH